MRSPKSSPQTILIVREFSFLRGLAGGVSKVRDRDHYWDESNNPAYKLFLG
jgi:hypothetical protein